jgi:hypothetical protein
MIQRITFAVSLAVLSLPVVATQTLPTDVAQFISKRETCDHFRGEIPPPAEKARMKEVKREIQKWCRGTDMRLAQLKRKYAANAPVIGRLEEFEPQIEAGKMRRN